MKTKSSVPTKSPWGCIGIALFPLVLLAGFIGWSLTQRDEDLARERTRQQQTRQSVDTLAAALAPSGSSVSSSASGVITITLPASVAMEASERVAKELALVAREKSGAVVKIKSPAGQILAEAP